MKKTRKPDIGSELIAGMENALAHARGRKRAARETTVDRDNPEWTAKDFRRARPLSEVLPEIIATSKKARGHRRT